MMGIRRSTRVKRAWRVCVTVLALALALPAAGCRGGEKKPAPIMSAKDPAARAACYAIQQTFDTQAMTWLVANGGDLRLRIGVKGLVDAGAVPATPYCPAGGDYTWDYIHSALTCSIHGHYD